MGGRLGFARAPHRAEVGAGEIPLIRATSPSLRRAVFAIALVVHLVALYTPKAAVPSPVLGTDKLAHMALFGVVLWTGVRAGLRQRPLLVTLAINAVASEVVQALWLAKRSGDVWDTVADLIGLALALLLLRRTGRDRPGRDAFVPPAKAPAGDGTRP